MVYVSYIEIVERLNRQKKGSMVDCIFLYYGLSHKSLHTFLATVHAVHLLYLLSLLHTIHLRNLLLRIKNRLLRHEALLHLWVSLIRIPIVIMLVLLTIFIMLKLTFSFPLILNSEILIIPL